FTPDNGEIKIGLHYLKKEKSIEISIKDNGIGIPEKHLDQLFEGVSKIKRKGLNGEKSTGLGLYICKQIVSIHKGRITAENNKDVGSNFKIILPVPIASSAYF
ncbi:MAG TPA: ATP-binding protein, partial [Salinimicrobium sp.]|nr:ATP-binding protein [Salinimicrobium sp.]